MRQTLIKHIIKLSDLKLLAEDDNACITLKKKCARCFRALPGHLKDIKKSLKEHLNSIITTYDTQLDGILLNFKNVKIKPLVSLTEDITVSVNYFSDVYIFRPQVDKILKGIVNKKSQDHIGCLVHGLFNATISRPKEVNFVDWVGKELNIGDEIIFKVIVLKMEGRLPYIHGCLIENDTESKGSEEWETNISTAQILTPSSSNLNTFQLNTCEKITKLLNPSFSSSDEESTVNKKKRKRSSKYFSTVDKSSEKEKFPFINTRLDVDEVDIDSSSPKKRRKLQH